MRYIQHIVSRNETLTDIVNRYNTDINTIIYLNRVRYASFMVDPYMIFEGWQLRVPLVTSGVNYDTEVG